MRAIDRHIAELRARIRHRYGDVRLADVPLGPYPFDSCPDGLAGLAGQPDHEGVQGLDAVLSADPIRRRVCVYRNLLLDRDAHFRIGSLKAEGKAYQPRFGQIFYQIVLHQISARAPLERDPVFKQRLSVDSVAYLHDVLRPQRENIIHDVKMGYERKLHDGPFHLGYDHFGRFHYDAGGVEFLGAAKLTGPWAPSERLNRREVLVPMECSEAVRSHREKMSCGEWELIQWVVTTYVSAFS